MSYVHKYLTLEDTFTVCEIDLTSSLAYFKLNAKHKINNIAINQYVLQVTSSCYFTFEPCSDFITEVATVNPFFVISDIVKGTFTTYVLCTIVSTYNHSNHTRVTIIISQKSRAWRTTFNQFASNARIICFASGKEWCGLSTVLCINFGTIS